MHRRQVSSLPTLELPRQRSFRAHQQHLLSLRGDHQRLAGVDIEVIQFGSTTCGKPYGFYPQDNCGTTYFTTHSLS